MWLENSKCSEVGKGLPKKKQVGNKVSWNQSGHPKGPLSFPPGKEQSAQEEAGAGVQTAEAQGGAWVMEPCRLGTCEMTPRLAPEGWGPRCPPLWPVRVQPWFWPSQQDHKPLTES